MKKRHGFTLIELVMVIVIIGILAAVAIPRYIDLQTQANEAAEQGTIGAVRSGIMTYYAENRSFPTALDSGSNGDSSATNEFFVNVLEYGITDDWSKSGTTYTGPAGGSYSYDAADGSFR